MKPIFYSLFFILSLILVGCEKKEPVDQDDLVERDGLWYEKFSKEPYTGEMVDWSEEGQLVERGFYENGLKIGLWEKYYGNGNIQEKSNYLNGKLEGFHQWFHEDGSLSIRSNYEDGIQEHYSERYYENGSLMEGISLEFYDYGPLKKRFTYVKGRRTMTEWFYESGSLMNRWNYKDGKSEGLHEFFSKYGSIVDKNCFQNDERVDMSFCEGEQNSN